VSGVQLPDEDDDYEVEFEGWHFHAKDTIDEDYKLIIEQSQINHKYWLSDYALRRVRMNQNYILLIVGGVGTGKSYTAMSLAEDIDPYFSVDRVIFHPKDFIELLDSGLPKGSVIMWEEVGVSLSSRDWYKEQNKIVSSLFETFRRHNLILIMTVPFVKFIDSRIRSMIHGFAEMIDPTFTGGKFGWLKYFHVIVEQRTGKIKHRYPRIRDSEGKIQILQGVTSEHGNMHFTLPSKELIPLYEKKKLDFVKWQQDTGLKHFEDKKDDNRFGIREFIEIFTKNPRKYHLVSDEEDKKICELAGVDILFFPSSCDIYTKDEVSILSPNVRGFVLEGQTRPSHFNGVLTVVMKLLNIIKPTRSYFGKKDAQQLNLITLMVKQFFMDVEIVPIDTVREEDGLAMSSRNVYLSDKQRVKALKISSSLYLGVNMVSHNILDVKEITNKIRKSLEPLEIFYVEILNRDFEPIKSVEIQNSIILVEVKVGKTRLLDNIWL